MAERRMFAKTIIDSDTFLEMPSTAQLLYFHLSMRADDDGFVNKPRAIMRICGAKEDDMRILIEKRFIIPFESGIVVIRHWKIHNYIRRDLYKKSPCETEKKALVVVSGVYESADTLQERNESVTETARERSEAVTETVRDCNETLTQDKERDRDSLKSELGYSQVNHNTSHGSEDEELDYKKILELFCEICDSLPKPYQLNDTRIKRIKKANKELKGDFESFFRKIESSDFLTGRLKDCDFKASFDWVLKPANFIKILEGNYDNRGNSSDDPYGYKRFREQQGDDNMF